MSGNLEREMRQLPGLYILTKLNLHYLCAVVKLPMASCNAYPHATENLIILVDKDIFGE
jgi:hypothetical protein